MKVRTVLIYLGAVSGLGPMAALAADDVHLALPATGAAGDERLVSEHETVEAYLKGKKKIDGRAARLAKLWHDDPMSSTGKKRKPAHRVLARKFAEGRIRITLPFKDNTNNRNSPVTVTGAFAAMYRVTNARKGNVSVFARVKGVRGGNGIRMRPQDYPGELPDDWHYTGWTAFKFSFKEAKEIKSYQLLLHVSAGASVDHGLVMWKGIRITERRPETKKLTKNKKKKQPKAKEGNDGGNSARPKDGRPPPEITPQYPTGQIPQNPTGRPPKVSACDTQRSWRRLKATVVMVRGRVSYQRGGKGRWSKVKKGAIFKDGTRIKTGYRSSAVLQIGSTQVYVKPLTEMTITIFAATPDNRKCINIHIRSGGLTVPVKKDRKRTDKRVSTPSCTTGVTGTIFGVSHDRATGISVVELFEGKVVVTHERTGAVAELRGDGKGHGQRALCTKTRLFVETARFDPAKWDPSAWLPPPPTLAPPPPPRARRREACPAGWRQLRGRCLPPRTTRRSCPEGMIRVGRRCVHERIRRIRCPSGWLRINDICVPLKIPIKPKFDID